MEDTDNYSIDNVIAGNTTHWHQGIAYTVENTAAMMF